MFERFDLQRPIAVGNLRAKTAARRQRHHFVGGKQPLGENGEHFAAHISGRADDGDIVTHR